MYPLLHHLVASYSTIVLTNLLQLQRTDNLVLLRKP